MEHSKARLTTVLLVVILAVSAIALGSAVSSLGNGFAVKAGGTGILLPNTGYLLVWITNGEFYGGIRRLSVVNITVRPMNSFGLAALTFHTNSSGSLMLPENPGEYSVKVTDISFSLMTILHVLPKEVTELDVTVSTEPHRVTFYEVVDQDSSGWLTPWSTMTAETDSTLQDASKSVPLFLDVQRKPSILQRNITINGQELIQFIFYPPEEVQVTALGLDTRTSGVWLTLRPKGFLNLSGDLDFWLVTYKPQYKVSTYAV